MRFHKFEDYRRGRHAWFDLDSITGFEDEGEGVVRLISGGWGQQVRITVDELLDLLDPVGRMFEKQAALDAAQAQYNAMANEAMDASKEDVVLATVNIPGGMMGPNGSVSISLEIDKGGALPTDDELEKRQAEPDYPDEPDRLVELEAAAQAFRAAPFTTAERQRQDGITQRVAEARIDELDRIEAAVKAEGWWIGSWIARYIQRRRREIEHEA